MKQNKIKPIGLQSSLTQPGRDRQGRTGDEMRGSEDGKGHEIKRARQGGRGEGRGGECNKSRVESQQQESLVISVTKRG
jgi:hypothetical protein